MPHPRLFDSRHALALATSLAMLALAACEGALPGLPPAPQPPGPASITGRVVDPDASGAALTGARVALEGTSLATLSDADGLFALRPVPAGRYVLTATAASGVRALRRPLLLAADTAIDVGELQLGLGGEVRGRVLLSDPAADPAGTLLFLEGTQVQAITGADGTFDAKPAPVGAFRLIALRPGYGPAEARGEVRSGEVTTLRDLALQPAPSRPATVTGRIDYRGTTSPKQARVTLLAPGATQPAATADVGADGRFTLPGVALGVYALEATGEGWRPASFPSVAIVLPAVDVGTLVLVEATPLDTDADGLPDSTDPDDDGDGLEDTQDAFPLDSQEWADADEDALGDNADDDDDDDTLTDTEELSPGLDDAVTNPLAKDTDADGHDDATDDCPALANADQADADEDGRGDACDPDPDGDAIPSSVDDCPLAFDPGQNDLDHDGQGDACDPDLDGDGLANAADRCPAIADETNTDTDGDGAGDACDPDLDGDGATNLLDDCPALLDPEQKDLDRDGVGDACDPDRDGDGLANADDDCPSAADADQLDTDDDALGDACDPDLDGDDVENEADLCPRVEDDQADLDRDGFGDACDADLDGDGLPNDRDDCPRAADPLQADTDGDHLGDACDADLDGDDVPNAQDDCPSVPNATQADLDRDGLGDACDLDSDGDGVINLFDDCVSVVNPSQADLDRDGSGDACDDDVDGDGVANAQDNCPGAPNGLQTDTDTDGVGDACDLDVDGDSAENTKDNCPAVANATQKDTDRDGLGDACDPDRDGDGLSNGVDNCADLANPTQDDLDLDRLGDACDPDLDGDSVANASDNCPRQANADQADANADGTGNACDPTYVAPAPNVPTIASFSPTAGVPGSAITITGTNFDDVTLAANQVTINGVSCTPTSATKTQLIATIASNASTGRVGVRTLGGAAQTTTAFTVYRPPAISDVQPRTIAQGGTLTIYGSEFDPSVSGNLVKLGGVALTVTSATSLVLKATVPANGVAGTLAVTTQGGTATTSYAIALTPPPTITNLNPNAGLAGARVLILGTSFGTSTSGVTVKFNGVAATVSSVTDALISTAVPAGATTGSIVVTTPSGVATSGTFTIDPQLPKITGETGLTMLFATGMSAADLTWRIDGANLAPVGVLRLSDGRTVNPEPGASAISATFVLPADWPAGGLTYVRGDGLEAALTSRLRAIRVATQALNPVPDQWVQRGDRSRWYGNVGKMIYPYDGTTLVQAPEPPWDDGATPGVIVPTPDGGYLLTTNGLLNTAARTRVGWPFQYWWGAQTGSGFWGMNVSTYIIAGTARSDYIFTAINPATLSSTNLPGASMGNLPGGTTINAGRRYDNTVNGRSYATVLSTGFVPTGVHYVVWVTPTAQGQLQRQYTTIPSLGWWVFDDDTGIGGVTGSTYSFGTASNTMTNVTLPEAPVGAAISFDRKLFVMRSATRLMVYEHATGKLAANLPFTTAGNFKDLYREFDRNEWVIRTDDAAKTLVRITIDP